MHISVYIILTSTKTMDLSNKNPLFKSTKLFKTAENKEPKVISNLRIFVISKDIYPLILLTH